MCRYDHPSAAKAAVTHYKFRDVAVEYPLSKLGVKIQVGYASGVSQHVVLPAGVKYKDSGVEIKVFDPAGKEVKASSDLT